MRDEDLKFFFARISRLETTIAVSIKKSESDIVQIIFRSFRNATML